MILINGILPMCQRLRVRQPQPRLRVRVPRVLPVLLVLQQQPVRQQLPVQLQHYKEEIMKILLNPKKGAPIKNIWYKDVQYFKKDDNNVFQPGMIMKFDDDIADFLLNLYRFLNEMSAREAKEYIARSKKKYRCDAKGCDFASDQAIALSGHKRKHDAEKSADELNLPMVAGQKQEEKPKASMAEKIESDNIQSGLTEGEGLRKEYVGPRVMHR